MKPQRKRPLRRGMWIALSFVLAWTIGGLQAAPAQASEQGKWSYKQYGPPEPLLAPINAVSIYDGAVGQEDGHDVLYTTVKGSPAVLNVVDLDDYKLLRSFPLEGAGDSWHHEVAVDGSVYVTGGKKLWKYSPVTKQVQPVADFGTEAPWSLTTDEAGNAYVGTYPGGNVFKYEAATGQITNYGRMIGVQEQEYVRSIAYHQGTIYAGTAHGQLVKLDPATGTKTDIAASLGEQGFVYDLDAVDGRYLFARYSESKNMYIYDLDEGTWLDIVLSNVSGLHVTDSLDGKVYFVADGKLKSIRPDTLEVADTGMPYASSLRGADWVQVENDPDLPGWNLVTVQFAGRIAFFNIQTATVKFYDPVVQGTPLPLHGMEKDPDGKIYMSSLGAGVGAIYDPATGVNTTMAIGQADSMHVFGNKMYMGVYPGGHIYSFDLTAPPSAENPKHEFQLGDGQDRVAVITSGGGNVYFGSISTYGQLGGAVSVYDPSAPSGGLRVYRHIVQDQSVIGLAYKDGKLYGSTNVNNGLGSNPTATEAKMFVLNAATGEKESEFSLNIDGVVQPKFIGRLTVGPEDGYIWGAVNGYVFALDPATLQVVKSKKVYHESVDLGAWSAVELEWSEDGILYALFGTELIAVDPETLAYRNVTRAYGFVIGNDGHLYYSSGDDKTMLNRIQVTTLDEPIDPEEPEEPGQPGQPAPSAVYNGSFELPLDNGKIPGWSSLFGTSAKVYYEVSSERSASGSKSLKVVDTLRNVPGEPVTAVALQSDKIEVLPGERYRASVKIYIEEGTPSLLFRAFDENDKQVAEGLTHVSTNPGQWQDVTAELTAPPNAKYVRVFASSSSYNLSRVYYDDFNVTGKFPNQDATAGKLSISAPGTVAKGQSLNVSLRAEDASDLYGVSAVIRYDPAKFAVESVAVSEAFKGGNDVFFDYRTDEPGKIRLLATQLADRSVNGNTEIAVIRLKALDAPGNTELRLDKSSETAKSDSDETGVTYPLGEDQVLAVQITQLPEDVDQNGVVNLMDLIAVAKHAGQQATEQTRRLDVNGDGHIDIADVGLVAAQILQ